MRVFLSYIVLFVSLVAAYPCVFSLLGWLPDFRITYSILMLISFLLLLLVKKGFIIPPYLFFVFFVQSLVWILYSISYGDSSYLTRVFYLLLCLLLLMLQNKYVGIGFVKMFNRWILLQAVLSFIGFFLVLSNLIEPLILFKEMDDRTGYFFGLFCTNTYYSNFVRVAGFFDEPGALGCWGIFALLFNKLFFDNKKFEFVLVVCLSITFSLGFYAQFLFYLILYYFKRKNALRFVFLSLGFCCFLWFLASKNQMIDESIFGRLEYDETTQTILGDNRTDLSEFLKPIFLSSPVLGVGATNLINVGKNSNSFVGANPYTMLASDGIVGFLVSLLPLFLILFSRNVDLKYKKAVLILFLGFLQRPYDNTQFLYPLLTFTLFFQFKLHKLNENIDS